MLLHTVRSGENMAGCDDGAAALVTGTVHSLSAMMFDMHGVWVFTTVAARALIYSTCAIDVGKSDNINGIVKPRHLERTVKEQLVRLVLMRKDSS